VYVRCGQVDQEYFTVTDNVAEYQDALGRHFRAVCTVASVAVVPLANLSPMHVYRAAPEPLPADLNSFRLLYSGQNNRVSKERIRIRKTNK